MNRNFVIYVYILLSQNLRLAFISGLGFIAQIFRFLVAGRSGLILAWYSDDAVSSPLGVKFFNFQKVKWKRIRSLIWCEAMPIEKFYFM